MIRVSEDASIVRIIRNPEKIAKKGRGLEGDH
jgi:hypothetical protein